MNPLHPKVVLIVKVRVRLLIIKTHYKLLNQQYITSILFHPLSVNSDSTHSSNHTSHYAQSIIQQKNCNTRRHPNMLQSHATQMQTQCMWNQHMTKSPNT